MTRPVSDSDLIKLSKASEQCAIPDEVLKTTDTDHLTSEGRPACARNRLPAGRCSYPSPKKASPS